MDERTYGLFLRMLRLFYMEKYVKCKSGNIFFIKKVEWNNCIFLFYPYLCLSLIKNLT